MQFVSVTAGGAHSLQNKASAQYELQVLYCLGIRYWLIL